jgi:hypothetical protein
MRWSLVALGLVAVSALVASSGACGSQITVPDQGIIVTGCQQPAACFLPGCDCSRAAALGSGTTGPTCVIACTPSQADPNDPSRCNCLGDNDMGIPPSLCLEPSQACVGRGVFCGGVGALCVPAGAACSSSTAGAGPPQLIPTIGMPGLEPHCQFTDDVCCPGGATDGGIVSD